MTSTCTAALVPLSKKGSASNILLSQEGSTTSWNAPLRCQTEIRLSTVSSPVRIPVSVLSKTLPRAGKEILGFHLTGPWRRCSSIGTGLSIAPHPWCFWRTIDAILIVWFTFEKCEFTLYIVFVVHIHVQQIQRRCWSLPSAVQFVPLPPIGHIQKNLKDTQKEMKQYNSDLFRSKGVSTFLE